jgi:hypothetical protein
VSVSPRNYAVVLVLTIFLGFLGVHRFVVGKVGTGLLYFFTSGLFVIGWIVDIVVVATGSFRDSQGRVVTWKGQGQGQGRSQSGGGGFVPAAGETLEFLAEGKPPETDRHGRVIVRLGTGSQFEIPVHWVDDADIDAITQYFQGSKSIEEWDEGTITKRFRLIPELTDYWGGRCYHLTTPDGLVAFEIRDYFEERFGLTQQVLTEATAMLRGLSPSLEKAAFVFDVAVRVDYSVGTRFDDLDDDNDPGTLELDLADPVVRLRNPLNVQVRSAKN